MGNCPGQDSWNPIFISGLERNQSFLRTLCFCVWAGTSVIKHLFPYVATARSLWFPRNEIVPCWSKYAGNYQQQWRFTDVSHNLFLLGRELNCQWRTENCSSVSLQSNENSVWDQMHLKCWLLLIIGQWSCRLVIGKDWGKKIHDCSFIF